MHALGPPCVNYLSGELRSTPSLSHVSHFTFCSRSSEKHHKPTACAFWATVFAVILLAPVSAELSAQARPPSSVVEVLEGDWTCTGCVELSRVLILGDTLTTATGPMALESGHSLARDGEGSYWLSQIYSYRVFDASGRFLMEVGRRGEGPGEFQSRPGPTFTDPAGNVHIVDPLNARESVYSPAGELLEEFRLGLGVRTAAALLTPGERVVAGLLAQPGRVGLPLHVLIGDSIGPSFGVRTGEEMLRPIDLRRLVHVDGQGRIFSASIYSYDVNMWTSEGAHARRFIGPVLNAERVEAGPWTMEAGPPSKLVGLQLGPDGHLWVMRQIPSPTWRSNVEPAVSSTGILGVKLKNDFEGVFDTRIDIVDVASGRLVRTGTFPLALSGFVGPGLIWQTRLTEMGAPYVTIWRVVS